MPSPRHHDFGNLYIQFNVKFPTNLGTEEAPFTAEHVKLLEQVLPPRIEPAVIPGNATIEEVVLEELDPTREHTQMKNATGEDDDEEMGGGERVQCATQ
jgi:DnaJ family protein A protein 2